ncbi:MAG: VWA domain-containing protein [Candidatus Promineofilum sp.]|nr:VWA domain-containing protein [Promineifilum sp.]
MSLLAPAALALGLLAIPIILLYMLRLRRREQVISTTLLWRELVRDRTANAPWQRLRRNLLLLLQLLILAALVLALARPYWQSAAGVEGDLIVLLDSSASMQANDGENGATRFDVARAEVERLIDGMSGSDRMTLIAAGRAPVVLAAMTSDRKLLRQALDGAAAENNSADWAAAFSLAAASSQGLAEPRMVIVSDGGLPEALPSLPGEVEFIPVGRSDENLALSALAARPGEAALDLLVTVANKGQAAGQALLSLYIDGALFDSRRVTVDGNQDSHLTWAIPATADVIEARLEPAMGTADYLNVDNRAWSASGGQAIRRVLLVGEENLFLERFFAVMPGYELVRMPGSDFEQAAESGETFDLTLFDGVPVPATLPEGSILVVNPQPGGEGDPAPAIQVTRTFTATAVTYLASSPLLTDVDWRGINIAEAQAVEPNGLEVVVAAEGGPLLLAGEIDGRRVAVLTFDLHRSDLPLQIAFPVIMANITDWLNPGRMVTIGENPQPGTVVSLLPSARAESITVTLPDGTVTEMANPDASGPILFSDTGQTGLYTVSYRRGPDDIRSEQFAINFFNPEESRIRPADTITLGQEEIRSGGDGFLNRREIWPWLLLAGLAILMLEWWITYRRGAKRPSFLKVR